MKIYIGADHAGFGYKEKLVVFLKALEYEVIDKGAFEYNESDDFPDFIMPVAKEVSNDPKNNRGIVLGGSGQGEAMLANKLPHVRAAVFYGEKKCETSDDVNSIIRLVREHNDSNILSLGARFITEEEMFESVKIWLEVLFSEDEKYKRRINKMDITNG